jgi:pseudaminic acid synthase
MNRRVTIDNHEIGSGCPPYIVAEMSGNHNQDFSRALAIVDAAKAAGANAVKLQTYLPETITIDHDSDEFIVKGGLWDNRRLFELYKEAHTPWEWHRPIYEHARRIGITVFSSPFDTTAVDFLEELGTPAYKIASPELVDIPLIRKVARTGKPMVLSTGAATLEEISEALEAARGEGAQDLIVLHCTAAYPTPPEEANLVTLRALEEHFNVVVGLSDHTLGTLIPTLAFGYGAKLIEKHFTLSRSEGGVDNAFSLEPGELAQLVSSAQIAHAAAGQPAYGPTQLEAGALKNRRSLYVIAPISKGEIFTMNNIRSIRPAKGLAPKYLSEVLGCRAKRNLSFGEPLLGEMVQDWEISRGNLTR